MAVFWFLGCSCSGAAAEQDYHPTRVLIKPAPGRGADLARFRSSRGDRLLRRMAWLENVDVVEVPPGDRVADVVARYRQSGLCEFAELDYRVRPAVAPNDPRFLDGSLWHLHNTGQNGGLADADIDGPEAWDTLTSAANVIVAVVDTGVRFSHEDLAPNMWVNPGEIPNNGVDDDQNGYIDDVHGINASNGSGNSMDLDGHGTQVAGFIGARGNNGRGGVGVAWEVQIMACRFYDDAGVGFISDAAEAITYARQHGAKVINASFISTSFSSTLRSAINQCRAAGVIVVAAAGNDTVDTDLFPYYPASFDLDNIVAVAATTRADLLSGFSNYGALTTDLGAPGSSLYTTTRGSDTSYGVNSGSSFSAPLVAGAFALMYARHPSESYLQLIQRVFAAVDPLPSLQGRCSTGGRLNIARALGPSVAADFLPSRWAGEVPFELHFTNTSFGATTGWHWNFGDGGISELPNPQHTYFHEGEYEVTLTVTGSNGQTSTLSRVVSAVAGYEVASATYSWIDPSGMTPLPLANSGVSSPLSFPFPFFFYGRPNTNLFVSSKGMLGFDPTALSLAGNTTLPNPPAPNNIICPFWDDLRPGTAGAVYFGISGSAPDRRAVVSWVGVRHGSFPPAHFTFQAVLEERSHQIRFQYHTVDAGNSNPGNRGASATVGLEHASGHTATLYSFNGTAPLHNGQALVFRPNTSGGMLQISPTSFTDGVELRLRGSPDTDYQLEWTRDFVEWFAHSIRRTDATGVIVLVDQLSAEMKVYRARPPVQD